MVPRTRWARVNCSDNEKKPTVAYDHDVDRGIIFAMDVESGDEEWASWRGVSPSLCPSSRPGKKTSASRQAKLTEDVSFLI
jgi:hypothetical protein